MDSKPLVSVIIPAYNAEKFIGEALNSVIKQTWNALEIIVVNDGSTDRTGEIIKEIATSDRRIIYIEQSNMGCSCAKNVGLSRATGEFIQYLDADDILSDDKIEIQVDAIGENHLTIAVCKTVVFADIDNLETGREIDTSYLFSTEDIFYFILNLYGAFTGRAGMIQPNAFLMHKELVAKVGLWDNTMSPSPDEDGEYFCRALLSSMGIVYTSGVNYYRKLKFQTSLSKGKDIRFARGAFRSIQLKKKHLLQFRDTVLARKVLAEQYAWCAYMYGRDYIGIIDMVKEELLQLGMPKIPIIGGVSFRRVSAFLGFENSLRLIWFLRKLLRLVPR